MRPITDINELKKIQMDILSYVDTFCRDNNIQYSISGGTLIGAIRHGGYIPWDDDIDIMMTRENYDKFVALFPKRDLQYKVHTFDNTEGYYQPYAMVSDMQTKLEEPGLKAAIGVNIDVFPIDYVPDNKKMLKKILKSEHNLYNLFVISGLNWSNQRNLAKNLFIILSHLVLFPFSRISFSKKMDKIARTAVNTKTNTRGCLIWGYGAKEIMSAQVFDAYIDIKFEDRAYMAISDYDTYLSHLFGNYMQLPPKEKQISHHSFRAWWK